MIEAKSLLVFYADGGQTEGVFTLGPNSVAHAMNLGGVQNTPVQKVSTSIQMPTSGDWLLRARHASRRISTTQNVTSINDFTDIINAIATGNSSQFLYDLDVDNTDASLSPIASKYEWFSNSNDAWTQGGDSSPFEKKLNPTSFLSIFTSNAQAYTNSTGVLKTGATIGFTRNMNTKTYALIVKDFNASGEDGVAQLAIFSITKFAKTLPLFIDYKWKGGVGYETDNTHSYNWFYSKIADSGEIKIIVINETGSSTELILNYTKNQTITTSVLTPLVTLIFDVILSDTKLKITAKDANTLNFIYGKMLYKVYNQVANVGVVRMEVLGA